MGLFDSRIDVYHHIALDGASATKLNMALELLHGIVFTQGIIMADTQATLTKLQEATVSLAGMRQDLADLKALVASGATPQEVFDAVVALTTEMAATDAEYPPPPVG